MNVWYYFYFKKNQLGIYLGVENEIEATKESAKNIKAIDRTTVHQICSGQVVLNLATAVKVCELNVDFYCVCPRLSVCLKKDTWFLFKIHTFLLNATGVILFLWNDVVLVCFLMKWNTQLNFLFSYFLIFWIFWWMVYIFELRYFCMLSSLFYLGVSRE